MSPRRQPQPLGWRDHRSGRRHLNASLRPAESPPARRRLHGMLAAGCTAPEDYSDLFRHHDETRTGCPAGAEPAQGSRTHWWTKWAPTGGAPTYWLAAPLALTLKDGRLAEEHLIMTYGRRAGDLPTNVSRHHCATRYSSSALPCGRLMSEATMDDEAGYQPACTASATHC